jgi:GNAT superfamily N-acetyltransferase
VHGGQLKPTSREFRELVELVTQPGHNWMSEAEGQYLIRALAGGFLSSSNDYFFAQYLRGSPVSHGWYQVSRRNPAVGVMGYIITHPQFRRLGFSTSVVEMILEHFTAQGGKTLFLGTANPRARTIYLKAGFLDYHGCVMRWTRDSTPSEACPFENSAYDDEQARVRTAEWGDVALGTAFYSSQLPWIVRDFSEKIIVAADRPPTRCVSIYVSLMLRSEIDGNSMFVLENGRGSVVGCISIIRWADTKVIEVFVDLAFIRVATEFLADLLSCGGRFVSYAHETDEAKLVMLRQLGFRRSSESSTAGVMALTR